MLQSDAHPLPWLTLHEHCSGEASGRRSPAERFASAWLEHHQSESAHQQCVKRSFFHNKCSIIMPCLGQARYLLGRRGC